jgi:ribosomal protein S27E
MPKSMNRQAKTMSDGTVVLRQPEGGMGKIRCPRCHNPAVLARQQDGKLVRRCPSCGTEWISTPMK